MGTTTSVDINSITNKKIKSIQIYRPKLYKIRPIGHIARITQGKPFDYYKNGYISIETYDKKMYYVDINQNNYTDKNFMTNNNKNINNLRSINNQLFIYDLEIIKSYELCFPDYKYNLILSSGDSLYNIKCSSKLHDKHSI